MERIATLAKTRQCSGITSIGSGAGLLEWLLSEYFSPLSVTAIDSREDFGPVKWHCLLGKIPTGKLKIARVPREDALLFCYPRAQIPFPDYVASYTGDCIIIIGDDSCTPFPGNNAFEFMKAWKLSAYEEFINRSRCAHMYMYARER